jgi:hypothetical protein
MQNVLQPATDDKDRLMGTQFVYLSLFLLVLAFFILLVSISTIETNKSKAVMKSLSDAFTTIVPTGEEASDFSAKEGDVLAGSAFQEKITGLFATAFRVAKIQIVKPGGLMQVDLPTRTLFVDGEGRVRDSAHLFLDRLVAALGGRPPGFQFDVEIVIGAGKAPGAMLPAGRTLELTRAGAIAGEMLARGAPPESIAVGIAPAPPEQVIMRFYVRHRGEATTEGNGRMPAGSR